jgi:hypothetical protein
MSIDEHVADSTLGQGEQQMEQMEHVDDSTLGQGEQQMEQQMAYTS